uniref:Sodium:neurotransmitter symporter domain containing protein n=1 Tax=Haemonchus contortus TaxID=6289 RepID=A0A7I4Z6R6_HAECO
MTTDESRGAWGSQLHFILTCISFAVGLGNLWRFPAIAYENGGAVFIIPYVICSVLVGLPCLYLEFLIGQLTQSGPSKAFRYFMPALQGVGWAMSIVSVLIGIYYNVVVAWCLLYIFDVITLQSGKWTSCNNFWNSKKCYDGCFSPTCRINSTLAAQEFFHYRLFIKNADGVEREGVFNWEIFIALSISWLIVCLSLIKGVSVIGKISYLTATLPYIIITIMLVRGVTMDGAKSGIDYLLHPDMNKLLTLTTWIEAAKQLCFSLSIGVGGLLALASFNKEGHNCFRDATYVVFFDGLMSIIGSIAVFSVIGQLSLLSGKPIETIFSYEATSITFVTYPQALSGMPASGFFAFLLFLMFLLLGISSQFGYTQSAVTTLTDQFPSLRRWKGFVVVGFCLFSLLVGLTMCLPSGYHWFKLFFNSIAGTPLLIICLIEIALCVFTYGPSHLLRDIKKGIDFKPNTWLMRIFGPSGYMITACWIFFTPIMLLIMVVLGVREDFGKAGHDHNLFLQYLPLMAIPTFIIINIFTFIKRGKSWKDVFRVQRVLESLEISGTNNKRKMKVEVGNGEWETKNGGTSNRCVLLRINPQVHHERDSTINGWDEQKD